MKNGFTGLESLIVAIIVGIFGAYMEKEHGVFMEVENAIFNDTNVTLEVKRD